MSKDKKTRIVINVTEEEKQQAQRQADRAGMTLTQLIKMLLSGQPISADTGEKQHTISRICHLQKEIALLAGDVSPELMKECSELCHSL